MKLTHSPNGNIIGVSVMKLLFIACEHAIYIHTSKTVS